MISSQTPSSTPPCMLLDVNLLKAGFEPIAGQHQGYGLHPASCGRVSKGVQAGGTHIPVEN